MSNSSRRGHVKRSHTERLYAVTVLRGEALTELPLACPRTRTEIARMLARGYTIRALGPLDIVAVRPNAADEARLRNAGFMPVIRWVDVAARSDTPLKTVEALTLLDRRESQQKRG